VCRDEIWSLAGRDDEILNGRWEFLDDCLPFVLKHGSDVRPAVVIGLNVRPEAEVFGKVSLLPREVNQQDVVPMTVEGDTEVRCRRGFSDATFVKEDSCSEC
jgi:hypothetical protein